MRRVRQLLYRRRGRDRHISQRVKIFYRQLQFLPKEFPHVGRAGRSPAKKQTLGRVALLLRAIMTDGPHHLSVKPRHRASHQFGNTSDFGVGWLGVGAAEADESVPLLSKISRREW